MPLPPHAIDASCTSQYQCCLPLVPSIEMHTPSLTATIEQMLIPQREFHETSSPALPRLLPQHPSWRLASPSQIRACLLIEAGAGAMPLSIHPYWAGASLSKATLRKLSPQALLLPAGCSFPEAPHASGKASGATGQCLAAAPHPGWGWGRRQGICRQSPASWPASGASAPAASAASNTHTSDDETHTSLLR